MGRDDRWAPEAIALARLLVSDDAPQDLRELAYKFAAGQIDLVRVNLARHQIVANMLTDEGFEPARQTGDGYGLVGMRERLALLGGRLRVESGRDAGTTIAAEVPVG